MPVHTLSETKSHAFSWLICAQLLISVIFFEILFHADSATVNTASAMPSRSIKVYTTERWVSLMPTRSTHFSGFDNILVSES